MSVKTMQTPEVQELLKRIAGLDNEGGNSRAKEIVHRLMSDIFQIVEDFDVTPEELWRAVYYINDLGGQREASLLAPGIGIDKYLDIRMDAEDAEAGLAGGTPRTIEGPLYVDGAPLSEGFARMDDGTQEAEPIIITGKVTDENGKPLAGAIVDIWHADLKGAYSYFDKTQSDYNLRRRIKTDSEGNYTAQSIMPSGYGCPEGGATSNLLKLLGRHGERPAHIHYFVSKPGYKHLTTQINIAGDKYTYDDFAFATRDELVVEAKPKSGEHGLDKFSEVRFDIKLVTTAEEKLQQRHERLRALEGAAQ
jgi:catechol 1,2-dioxygenase